jgi:hypothetical protein
MALILSLTEATLYPGPMKADSAGCVVTGIWCTRVV